MKIVSTAELKTHANQILKQVSKNHQPVVITRHGKPCAVVEPCTEDDIEGLAFEYGSAVFRMVQESAGDMKAGRYITMRQFAKKHGIR